MNNLTTVGELRKLIGAMDDGTVLFFKVTMGGASGAVYPVEVAELEPGEPPILCLSGPRSKAVQR